MTYSDWKAIKAIRGGDNEKVIRDFERSNPGLAALFTRKEREEQEKMRQIMKEPDRMERWKQIAKSAYAHDPVHMVRREREGYSSLKNGIGKLVKGDELYITSLDRLGRNKDETLKELQYYKDNGIRIRVLDIPTTMMEIGETESQTWIIEMINNILIEVLASLAEQERKTIKERQAEGIDQMPVNPKTGKKRSLKTGRDIGRPVAEYPGNWKEVYAEWKAKKITAVEAMERMKLKKNTFYNLVKKYEA